ncbi:MAG: DsrE/DsrF/DrsH-like family protein [Spirochaetes bacterium]|nr:DsrE/DsrF/DrsH-like family protein [Spirochaetota bacterium]
MVIVKSKPVIKMLESIQNQIKEIQDGRKDKIAMVVFSGDLDKLLAAFIIATGSVAMGMEAVMFFTFWATPALRDKKKKGKGKNFFGKMFSFMLPKGASRVKLSKMNMGGLGTAMMKHIMKKKNIQNLDGMIALAAELGVKIYVCEMSMDLMGLKMEEMIDYPDIKSVGVATFLQEASDSKIQLFI